MALQPNFNNPSGEQEGNQPYGAAIKPFLLTPVTATGNLQSRPTNAPSGPSLFQITVTAAAAVVLTLLHTGGWKADDVIAVFSPAQLANTVTVQDATGPTTCGVLPVAGRVSTLYVRFSGTVWSADPGGGAGIT